MSEISHEELQAYELSASTDPIRDEDRIIAKLTAEIRRLRAENAGLKEANEVLRNAFQDAVK